MTNIETIHNEELGIRGLLFIQTLPCIFFRDDKPLQTDTTASLPHQQFGVSLQ